MKVLFFGDVVGLHGVAAIEAKLDQLIRQYDVDFVIANGENVSKGRGLFYKDYERLVRAGVECVTLGNHYRDKYEIDDYINEVDRLVRPANLLHYDLGEGYLAYDFGDYELIVVNMLGKVFLKDDVSSDIVKMNEIIDAHPGAIFFVDYHGEATSEKAMFAHYFDGQIAAVVGTHTHVQTADGRVLPKGTAFISDVGYCGLAESILGFVPESVIRAWIYGEGHFELNEKADARLNCVLIDIDESTRLARSIQTLNVFVKKEELHATENL